MAGGAAGITVCGAEVAGDGDEQSGACDLAGRSSGEVSGPREEVGGSGNGVAVHGAAVVAYGATVGVKPDEVSALAVEHTATRVGLKQYADVVASSGGEYPVTREAMTSAKCVVAVVGGVVAGSAGGVAGSAEGVAVCVAEVAGCAVGVAGCAEEAAERAAEGTATPADYAGTVMEYGECWRDGLPMLREAERMITPEPEHEVIRCRSHGLVPRTFLH